MCSITVTLTSYLSTLRKQTTCKYHLLKKATNIILSNVTRKTHIKYLGVFIDEHLNWGRKFCILITKYHVTWELLIN